MRFPTPEDPANAPVWENYVVAQTVQASLGIIPSSALAVGVEVQEHSVRVRFQLKEVSDQDAEDMDDIIWNLEALLGDAARVERVEEVLEKPRISPDKTMRWIYLTR